MFFNLFFNSLNKYWLILMYQTGSATLDIMVNMTYGSYPNVFIILNIELIKLV